MSAAPPPTVARARQHLARTVEWRDLVAVSPGAAVKELLLPAPWLVLSLYLAGEHLYPAALAASFVFFLTGLRVVHNAYHYALGLPRLATEAVMAIFSLLMLGSMHAVQWNHLRHHRHCLAADDLEAASARLSALGALAVGPLFPIRLHRAALASARPGQRRWIAAELSANVVWGIAVFGACDSIALRYHMLAMAAGQCLTSFFAVWTVHHDCDGVDIVARTIRSRFKSTLTFSMFFHLEHHLFPKIPTARLHILARRLDRAAPTPRRQLVF